MKVSFFPVVQIFAVVVFAMKRAAVQGFSVLLRQRQSSCRSASKTAFHHRCYSLSVLPVVRDDQSYNKHNSYSLHPSCSTQTRILFSTSAKDTDRISDEESVIYGELQRLSRLISQHDDLYYNRNDAQQNQSDLQEISDAEFDALCERESQIGREYPHLLAKWKVESGLGESATRSGRVGSETRGEGRRKRKHAKPMLSLENVHDTAQLLAWLKRVRRRIDSSVEKDDNDQPIYGQSTTLTIVTEPKLDGVSLNLHYERQTSTDDFSLVWASTRGDGRHGQDVCFSNSMSIPSSLPSTQSLGESLHLEVRGEVVLPQSVFNEIRQSSIGLNFSNARNAASGIIMRKEEEESREDLEFWWSKLQFYAYELYSPTSQFDIEQSVKWLQAGGFDTARPSSVCALSLQKTEWEESDISSALEYYNDLGRHRQKKSSSIFEWGDYEMDGCVHKVSETHWRKILKTTSRAPRWAIAHKFPATAIVSELLSVFPQVGRTGALTPVAELKPVDLNGVTIQRATLHNYPHLQQMLGSTTSIPVGTKVMVRRAGDVIPQVVGVVDGETVSTISQDMISLVAPTTCPACGSSVSNEDSNSSRKSDAIESIGPVLRCQGPPLGCQPRAVALLQHAFSRDALDVAGLSHGKIEKLMELGLLRTPRDIFVLSQDPASFLERLEAVNATGWGEKSVNNLCRAANRVATEGVTLTRFLFSLGIRFAGVQSSAILASVYKTAGAFLKDLERCTGPDTSFEALREDIDETKGIGPSLIYSLEAFAQDKDLSEAARLLANQIKVHEDDTVPDSEDVAVAEDPSDDFPLAGLSVVCTGSIPDMARSEVKKVCKQMGARVVQDRITKATQLVVVGNRAGKKLEQANKLGVRVMEAEEFLDLIATFSTGRV